MDTGEATKQASRILSCLVGNVMHLLTFLANDVYVTSVLVSSDVYLLLLSIFGEKGRMLTNNMQRMQ